MVYVVWSNDGFRGGRMTAYRKYNARMVSLDGFTFDSSMEAQRYAELKILEKAGEIRDLKIHPEYVLEPSFKKNGKTYRKIVYEADFSYTDANTEEEIVEDVKGYKTDVYRLKRRLFEARFPNLTITEVTK